MGIVGKSQLMQQYNIACLKTWHRKLEPISHHFKKGCKIYTPAEVARIRDWMERGVG